MTEPRPAEQPPAEQPSAEQRPAEQPPVEQPEQPPAERPALPPFAQAFVPQFEQVRAVLERLPGFALIPVEVPSRDVGRALVYWLSLHGRRVHAVMNDVQWRMLPAAILSDPPGPEGVAAVIAPREITSDTRSALRLLNQRRDTVATQLGAPLLWCGDADFFRTTAETAPDFWSVREIPLKIDLPPELIATPFPWKLELKNPSWFLSRTTRGGHISDFEPRQMGEQTLTDPDPRRRLNEARYLLSNAERLELDPRLIDTALTAVRAGEAHRDLALGLEIAGGIACNRDDLTAAETYTREAHDLFEQLDDRSGRGRAAHLLGRVLHLTGRHHEAETYLCEALRLASEVDDWQEEASALLELSLLRQDARDLGKAITLSQDARARFERIGDLSNVGRAHLIASFARADLADLTGAVQEAEAALKIAERLRSPKREAVARTVAAIYETKRGHPTRALVHLHRTADILESIQNQSGVEKAIEVARSLPDTMATDRDTLIARLEARLSMLEAAADEAPSRAAPTEPDGDTPT